MSLTINGLPGSRLRWRAPWCGVWIAELELLGGDITPSGRVVIVTTEGVSLVGTVDDDHSGTFGEKRFVRVLGGGGGWQKVVRAQHYHSDVGLPLATVVSTTAAEAGELATVLTPSVIGLDYVRRKAEASQIFVDAGVDWWVGVDGVTRVGTRLPGIPPTSLEVLDWNPELSTVSFRAEVLVEPGTIIVDPRFGVAKKVVREVEAVIENASVKGTLWLADASPASGYIDEIVENLGKLARSSTRADYGAFYEYQVIAMAGDRVELHAVKSVDGVPDVLPGSVWAGASGYRATLLPSSRVLVGFRAKDPKQPFVAFYEPPDADGWRPVKLELDALFSVEIGAAALGILLGESGPTAYPVVRLTPTFITWLEAASTALGLTAPPDIASAKVVSS